MVGEPQACTLHGHSSQSMQAVADTQRHPSAAPCALYLVPLPPPPPSGMLAMHPPLQPPPPKHNPAYR